MPEVSDYLDLTSAAKCFPGDPATSAIWRWCRKGCKARNRERIHLQHVRRGSKLFTTKEWCQQFQDRLAAEDVNYFRTAAVTRDTTANADGWRRAGDWNKIEPGEHGIENFKQKWEEIAEISRALQFLPDPLRAEIIKIVRSGPQLPRLSDAATHNEAAPILLPTFQKTRTARQREAAIRQALAEVQSWKRKRER